MSEEKKNQEQNSNTSAAKPETSVVAFDAKVSNTLIAKDLSSGGVSFKPIGRKAFALTALAIVDGKPLTGRALKVAHWKYLNECATQAAGAVAEQLAKGTLKVTGWSVNKDQSAGAIKYETAEHFSRHEVEEKAPKQLTEAEVLEMVAKSKGITVEELNAALELATAK